MNLHRNSLLTLLALWISICTGQDQDTLPPPVSMCTPGSNATTAITRIGDGTQRVKGECVCRVTPIPTTDGIYNNSNLHIVVEDFACTRNCEWRMKVYQGGCAQLDTCCSTATLFPDQNFLIRSAQVRADTEVYIAQKNYQNDQTGTLLVVSVRTIADNFSQPYTGFKTECGLAFDQIPMKTEAECLLTTTPTPSTLAPEVSTPRDTNTSSPTETGSGGRGDGEGKGSRENTELLSGLTLIGIIAGGIASFVVILISVIAIAVCLHKRKSSRSSSADSTTTSQRKIGDWMKHHDGRSEMDDGRAASVYSYSRSLPPTSVPGPRSIASGMVGDDDRRYPPCFDPPPNECYYKYADSYRP